MNDCADPKALLIHDLACNITPLLNMAGGEEEGLYTLLPQASWTQRRMSNEGQEALGQSCQPPRSLREATSQAAFSNVAKSVIEGAAEENPLTSLAGLRTSHESVSGFLCLTPILRESLLPSHALWPTVWHRKVFWPRN